MGCLLLMPPGTMCVADINRNCVSILLTKPVSIDQCYIDVCFLMDTSGSIAEEEEVHAWDQEGAVVTSMVASISSANSDSGVIVKRFSDSVVTAVEYMTKRQIGADTTFVTTVRSQPALVGGTEISKGIKACKVSFSSRQPLLGVLEI